MFKPIVLVVSAPKAIRATACATLNCYFVCSKGHQAKSCHLVSQFNVTNDVFARAYACLMALTLCGGTLRGESLCGFQLVFPSAWPSPFTRRCSPFKVILEATFAHLEMSAFRFTIFPTTRPFLCLTSFLSAFRTAVPSIAIASGQPIPLKI